ncbi:hypothetical protein MASR2M117_05790 [Paludibacter sp.]
MTNQIKVLSAFLIILFSSCNDSNSVTDIGSSLQSNSDKIIVNQHQFHISSENFPVEFMYSKPDSFLLGTFYDAKYGSIHADIFAQVEYPRDYVYPVNNRPDSIKLIMYYNKYFGDKHSPMHVNVYEMNKSTFEYLKPYKSNLNPNDYVDFSNPSLLIGNKTFTAVSSIKSSDSTRVSIKLSNAFLNKFSNIASDTYSSDEKFFDFFKGVYITTDFGSASMLYVRHIDIKYYHSYTYITKSSTGTDSIVTVNLATTFPASSWVRQVNRFLQPEKANIISNLESQPDQIHYISSPANIYTRIKLPVKEMYNQMEKSTSRLAINNAKIRVDIDEISTEKFTQPVPTNVLLIRESALNRFFTTKELPSDTCAILGKYSNAKNSDTGKTDYFYSFDIAKLVAFEFEKIKENNTSSQDSINFILVPVRLNINENNNITDVSQQFILSSVTICGGNHSKKPIKANIISSYF